MKRYIKSSKEYDYTRICPNEEYPTTIEDAIDGMCYETYDNYYPEYVNGELKFNDLVKIVIDHLDDPELYGLKVNKDYARSKVQEELKKYLD